MRAESFFNVLAYPNATIYHVDSTGLSPVAYDETEHVQLTRAFLNDRERYVKRLLAPPPELESDDDNV